MLAWMSALLWSLKGDPSRRANPSEQQPQGQTAGTDQRLNCRDTVDCRCPYLSPAPKTPKTKCRENVVACQFIHNGNWFSLSLHFHSSISTRAHVWRAVMCLFCSAWRHLAAQWNWRPDSWRNSHLPPHTVALVFIGISYSALRLQTAAALGGVTVNLRGNHSLIGNVFYIQKKTLAGKKTPQHRLTLRIFSHQIETVHISVVHFPEATVRVDGQMWLIHLWILLLVLQFGIGIAAAQLTALWCHR